MLSGQEKELNPNLQESGDINGMPYLNIGGIALHEIEASDHAFAEVSGDGQIAYGD